ncbi:hypothetical protein WEI85_20820 [Actinomycetes bacterium KLBMP 9797]
MLSPQVGRALVTWVAFVALLSGASVLATPRDSGAFVLSVLMLCLSLAGALLLLMIKASLK